MTKHSIILLLSQILWGSLVVFWKLLADVNSVYTLSARIVFSSIIAALVISLIRKWPEAKKVITDKRTLMTMAVAGLLVAVNWGLYIWCVGAGHILDASLAYYICPLLSILLGRLLFKEELTAAQILAVLVATVGVLYPMFVSAQIPIYAVVIAVSFAAYGSIKKTINVPGEISVFVETLVLLPVAVGILVYMELNGTGAVSSGVLSGTELLLLPAAGAVTVLPLFAYAYAIRHVSLSLSGILMFINPTLQFALGVILYDEALTQAKIVTFILVWIAVLIYLTSDVLKSRQNIKSVKA